MATAVFLTGNQSMTIQEALDRSLEDIRSGGASVEDCLRRYPDLATELRPLLRTAARLQATNDVRPSRAYKARLKNELLGQPARRRVRMSRLAIWILLLIAALAILIGLALALSSNQITVLLPLLTHASRSFALLISAA